MSDAFGATGSHLRTDFGIRFNFQSFADDTFALSSGDTRLLAPMLRQGAAEVHDFFLGPDPSVPGGIIEKLTAVLNRAEADIESQLGFRGHSIDVLA